MSLDDIGEVTRAFAAATRRAQTAGFRLIELHFAHGYLVHEFLSPLSNRREDGYGGGFEQRIRLALDVTRAVRAEWPDRLPLLARLSCTDWVDGGWTLEESVELARRLAAEGVDLVDCSSGGLVPYAAHRGGARVPGPVRPADPRRGRACPPRRWGSSARPRRPRPSSRAATRTW